MIDDVPATISTNHGRADTSSLHHQIDQTFLIFLAYIENLGKPVYEVKYNTIPWATIVYLFLMIMHWEEVWNKEPSSLHFEWVWGCRVEANIWAMQKDNLPQPFCWFSLCYLVCLHLFPALIRCSSTLHGYPKINPALLLCHQFQGALCTDGMSIHNILDITQNNTPSSLMFATGFDVFSVMK